MAMLRYAAATSGAPHLGQCCRTREPGTYQSVAVAAPLPPPTAPTTPKPPPTSDKVKPKIALVTKALHLAGLRGGTAKLSFTVSERGSATATAAESRSFIKGHS